MQIVLADDGDSVTMTARASTDLVGKAVRVADEDGVIWYGTVDSDGIALLTRQDLLPRK